MIVWLVAAALAVQTGDAKIDGFIADITAGRREAALARVFEMNSLTGRPNAVATSAEFVDKLLSCTYISAEPRNIGGVMYDLRWRCPDDEYYSLLDANWRPPQIVVGQFVSAKTREERRSNPPAPPTPRVVAPPPLVPKGFSDPRDYYRVAKYMLEVAEAGNDHAIPELAWSISEIYLASNVPSGPRSLPLIGANLRQFLSGCTREGQIEVDQTGAGMTVACANQTLNGRYDLDFEFRGQKILLVFVSKTENESATPAKVDGASPQQSPKLADHWQIAATKTFIAAARAQDLKAFRTVVDADAKATIKFKELPLDVKTFAGLKSCKEGGEPKSEFGGVGLRFDCQSPEFASDSKMIVRFKGSKISAVQMNQTLYVPPPPPPGWNKERG